MRASGAVEGAAESQKPNVRSAWCVVRGAQTNRSMGGQLGRRAIRRLSQRDDGQTIPSLQLEPRTESARGRPQDLLTMGLLMLLSAVVP